MAENDPRKARAFKQRTDVRDDSDEDPLVELARIVGEENNYYGARSEKAGPVRDEVSERGALSGDLESELLNELESSLAPRNPSAAPTPRAVAPAPRVPIRPLPTQPAAPADTDDGDELMRSIEEQLSAFERRNQSARAAPSAEPARPQWNGRSEQLRGRQASTREDADDEEESGAPEPMPRGQQRGMLRAAAAPDPGPIPGGSRAEQGMVWGNPVRSGVQPAGGNGGAIRGRPEHDSDERNFADRQPQVPLRPERAAQPSFAPSATAGWNEIAGTDDSFDDPRAVPREAQQTRSATGLRGTIAATSDADGGPGAAMRSAKIEAELAREMESGYSDGSSASTWPEPNVHYSDEEPRVAAAASDSDVGTTAVSSRGRRRSRKGLLVLASLLAVAVVGGGVAAYMRSTDQVASGPPPVIAAPEGAVKVDPPAQQQEAAQETVGQAVYNRVAGAAAPTEEQVVDGAEEPEEISRIVLPPPEPAPPPPDAAAADPQVAAADAGGAVEPTAGPRRVRTYLVRPDGTIVASEEAPAGAAAPEQPTPAEGEQQVAALSEESPAEPVTVPTAQINESVEPPAAEAAPAEPPAQSETQAAIADLAPTQSPDTPAVPPAAEAPPAGQVPTEVASAPSGEAAAPPAATEGNFVQLSSQRSMEQAQSSFAGMKQQFASVLGPLSADIQEADLGAKGTYYRVRVGPYSTRGEAITVCEQLKAAGGSCIVTK